MQSICCRAQAHRPLVSYRESFDHPDIKQLRQDLLQGIQNPICRVCWQDESVGLTSTRQDSIKGKSLDQMVDEVHRPRLKWLWVDPGNYCNLACRTCFPTFSTSIGVEWAKKYGDKQQIVIKKPNLDVVANEDLGGLETIMILGGEPFIDQEHLRIIDAVIQQKTHVAFTVIYVTNNTKPIPPAVVDYLQRYPDLKVVVVLSVDAVGQQFDYIRTKGHWRDFQQNFDRLDHLRGLHGNLTLTANITIGLLNCLYLDPLYTWIDQNQLSNTTVSFVEGAGQYQFKLLDPVQKQKVIQRLDASDHDLAFVSRSIQTAPYDRRLIDQFWKDVAWTREHLGLDINQYLPELVTLLTAG